MPHPVPPVPADCRKCGVCCFSESPAYVRVTGQDWTRLGERADDVAHFVGHRAFMRMRDGHCAALEIRRDETQGIEFFCTIYEQRPQICRDLARGSPECAGEIATKSRLVEARCGLSSRQAVSRLITGGCMKWDPFFRTGLD